MKHKGTRPKDTKWSTKIRNIKTLLFNCKRKYHLSTIHISGLPYKIYLGMYMVEKH